MASNFEERLASLVESFPILYNKSLTDFKDRNKKKNAWNEVAEKMDLETGDVAKQKFENLRARYTREKKRVKKAKRSGTSSAEVPDALRETSDTFPYLHFLDKYISPRATKSNLMPVEGSSAQEGSEEDVNENDAISDDTVADMDLSSVIPREDEESESTTDQDSMRQGIRKEKSAQSSSKQSRQTKETRRNKQEQAEQQQFEMIKVVGESLKSMCDSMRQQPQSGKKHEDEDDLFGVFVASQLKCMNPAQKARAKYHINNVIFQAMMVDEGSFASVQQHPTFMPDFSGGYQIG